MRFLPSGTRPEVAVVGFGYIGSCVGVTLADSGYSVIGIDSDHELIAEMRAGYCRFNDPGLDEALRRALCSGLTFSTRYDAIRDADVVVITVGTPVDSDRRQVTEHVESACSAVADHIRPGHLVIVKSTVAPGVTDSFIRPMLEKGGLVQGRDFGLAYCPERLAEGNAIDQLCSLPIVVGASDDESAEAACKFWFDALGVEVLRFSSPEVAELVKLADNWWIDANIALANELAKLCAALGVDVRDVIAGANSLPKGDSHVNILLPGVGVGGSCLTKDPWILWEAARARGLTLTMAHAAREVNDAMPSYAHGQILCALTSLGKNPAAAKVAVLGLSFKNNTNDLRHTPALPVVQALRASCGEIAIYDPLVARKTAALAFGMTPATSVDEAVQGADCVAVLAGHDAFLSLDLARLAGLVRQPCAFFDGRACYPASLICEMRRLGLRYSGIGRSS